MARRKNELDQWWLPLAEGAIAKTSPGLGSGLAIVRSIAASKDFSRNTRSDLTGLYIGGLILGALIWLSSRDS